MTMYPTSLPVKRQEAVKLQRDNESSASASLRSTEKNDTLSSQREAGHSSLHGRCPSPSRCLKPPTPLSPNPSVPPPLQVSESSHSSPSFDTRTDHVSDVKGNDMVTTESGHLHSSVESSTPAMGSMENPSSIPDGEAPISCSKAPSMGQSSGGSGYPSSYPYSAPTVIPETPTHYSASLPSTISPSSSKGMPAVTPTHHSSYSGGTSASLSPSHLQMVRASSSSSISSGSSVIGGGFSMASPPIMPPANMAKGYHHGVPIASPPPFPLHQPFNCFGDASGNSASPSAFYQGQGRASDRLPYPMPSAPLPPPMFFSPPQHHRHRTRHYQGLPGNNGGGTAGLNPNPVGQVQYPSPLPYQQYAGMPTLPAPPSMGPPPMTPGSTYAPLHSSTIQTFPYPTPKTPESSIFSSGELPVHCRSSSGALIQQKKNPLEEEDRAGATIKQLKSVVEQLQEELQRERQKQEQLLGEKQYHLQQHASTVLEINAALQAYRHDVVLLLHILDRVLSLSCKGQHFSKLTSVQGGKDRRRDTTSLSRSARTSKECIRWMFKILQEDSGACANGFLFSDSRKNGALSTPQPRGSESTAAGATQSTSFLLLSDPQTEKCKNAEDNTSLPRKDLSTHGGFDDEHTTVGPSTSCNEKSPGTAHHDPGLFSLLSNDTTALLTPSVRNLCQALRLRFETEGWDISRLYDCDNIAESSTEGKDEANLLPLSANASTSGVKADTQGSSAAVGQPSEAPTFSLTALSRTGVRNEVSEANQLFLEEELREVAAEVQQNLEIYLESLNYGFSGGIGNQKPLIVQIPALRTRNNC